ncbi:MAG: hypothetical protein H6559_29605 [Lewinellaceae bacterium]|nr:hypothetical protein [Lewinellaceae bacterium]
MTLGESCQITGANDPAESLKVILNVAPGDGSANVAPNIQPNASFNLPLGEEFPLADVNGNVSNYKAELDYARLTSLNSGVIIPGEREMSFGNYNLDYVPFNMLPPNDSFRFEVKVRILRDGQETETETKTVTFTTGPALDVIPEGNVRASYPMNGQYNFYKGEWAEQKGFILLEAGQPELFLDVPEGYYQRAKITRKNGPSYAFPVQYDPYEKKATFPLPGALMQKDAMYKIEIVNIPVSGGGGQGGVTQATAAAAQSMDVNSTFTPTQNTTPSGPAAQASQSSAFSGGMSQDPAGGSTPPSHVLYTIHFRTSAYNTFMEKLADIEQNHSEVQNFVGAVIFHPTISEPFDKFEVGLGGHEPLIECQAQISNVPWYQDYVVPMLYSRFPGVVSFAGFSEEFEVHNRPIDLGIPPVKAAAITQGDQEQVIEVRPINYHVGFVPAAANVWQRIENNCTQVIRKDFYGFRNRLKDAIDDTFFFEGNGEPLPPQVENNIWRSIPDWAEEICYDPDFFFDPPYPGTYPMQFQYKLPGLNTVTTVHAINLTKN